MAEAGDGGGGLHPADLRCGYRFHQREHCPGGCARSVETHSHPFWQLEITTAGTLGAHAGGRDLELGSGALLLLPPGTLHAFTYPAEAYAYLSVKFTVEGFDPPAEARRGEDPVLAAPGRSLTWLLADHRPARGRRRRAVEGLLATAVACAYGNRPVEEAIRDPVVRAAQHIIDEYGGRPLGVAELARRLGYSPSRLGVRFRTELGRSPKAHLDAERAALAGRLLVYSDRSVGEIADLLEFSDQFAFSRFFSRVTGESPLAHRRRGRSGP